MRNSGPGSEGRSAWGCALAAAMMLSSSFVAGDAALAQTAQSTSGSTRNFSVPGGSLAPALVAFGKQAGVQVSYVPSLAAGLTTSGINGTLPTNAALSQILAGTGLSFKVSGSKTIVIEGAGGGNTAAAAEPGAISLDTIDVSGGGAGAAAELPYQTPGSNAYISSETLDRVPAMTASDMFKNTPGVLGNSSHNGPQLDLNIRGIQGMNRVKVMVEGTQQDSTLHRGYNGPDNRSYVDQDLISGITIEKGPGTGPYGSGTTGGVVNMQTLTPDDILLDGKTYGMRLKGGVIGNTADPAPVGTRAADSSLDRPGLFDFSNASGSASAAFAYRDDNYEFVAAAAKRRLGNYFAGENGPATFLRYIDRQYHQPPYNIPPTVEGYSRIRPGAEVLNSSEDTTSTLLKAKFKFGDGQSIEVGHIGYESTYGYIYPYDTRYTTSAFIQEPLSSAESDRVYARYRWKSATNPLIDFSANAWRTEGTETTRGVNRIPWPHSDISAYGFEVWNKSRVDSAAGHFLFTYGAEHSQSEITQYPGDELYGFGGKREVSGAFLNGKWTPIDLVTFNAGIRYDQFETSGVSRVCPVNPNNCDYEPSGNTGSGFSPTAGVTVEPIEGFQLFAQYTEGYRPPSIRESIGTTQSGIVPNPELDAEQSRGWEYGANLLKRDIVTNGDRALFKLAYFDTYYTDYISYELNAASKPQFQNSMNVTIKGWEISGSYDAGVVFAQGNVTLYDKIEYCSAINPAVVCNSFLGGIGVYAGVPPDYSGSVTAGVRLFDQKLTLGGRAFFFGQRATGIEGPNGATHSNYAIWRPDTIFDAFGSYKMNENMEWAASVENVLDRYYLEPLALARTPSPGRTLRASLTMKY